MMIFVDRVDFVQCYRMDGNGLSLRSVNNIESMGLIMKPDEESDWLWDSKFRSWVCYQTLTGSEKRQIIGLLDKLNGIGYRTQENMDYRWSEITGLQGAKV